MNFRIISGMVILIWLITGMYCPAIAQNEYSVKSKGITLKISQRGEIVGALLGSKNLDRDLKGMTLLNGCKIGEKVEKHEIAGGGLKFIKSLVRESDKHRFSLTESFLPTTDSIRWEIEITDDGKPWSTAIETRLQYPVTKNVTFWTAWADPRDKNTGIVPDNESFANALISGKITAGDWADPLISIPVHDALFYYGAPYYEYNNPQTAYCPFRGDVICIPLATLLEKADDTGLSLVLSPEDLILDMTMETQKNGTLVFNRMNHRIGGGKIVRFSMDIVEHPADWRAALGWMSRRYEGFFDPPNPAAHKIAGTGAYSTHWSDFDTDKMKKMAFLVNWKASFDFPYMGMFIPPVNDKVEWDSYGKEKVTIPRMREYASKMRENGFYVLSYFNVTEFGADILYPEPPKKMTDNELWKNPNDFLYGKLKAAILRVPDKQKVFKSPYYGLTEPGKPFWTWGNGIVMDSGEPVYQNFLIEQAQRHIKEIPDASGICIDRMDWLRMYNHDRDDGVSWFSGCPVRSLIVSWSDLMDKLGPLMHDAGKVIYVNNHDKRIDLLKHVDGIFDEFTYSGCPLNTTALMCVSKPALGWVANEDQIKPNSDAFFQKYLYMGVFPMAPFPNNDHSLMPSEWVDKQYLDYGPLLAAMRGKRWVLEPHIIEVTDEKAKANIFETFNGYIIPLVYAGNESTVKVVLNGMKSISGYSEFIVETLYPGKDTWVTINFSEDGEKLTIDVPIFRNCAMVRLKQKM